VIAFQHSLVSSTYFSEAPYIILEGTSSSHWHGSGAASRKNKKQIRHVGWWDWLFKFAPCLFYVQILAY
jgi:hypothetical protein